MRARVAVIAVVFARGVMACVDGVTPDCTDRAVCSPIYGDAGPLSDGAVIDARPSDATLDSSRPDADASDAADADGG